MLFNINDLETAKYDDYIRNDEGLLIACRLTDSIGNIAYIKNLMWDEKQATHWLLQDKAERPAEIIVMDRNYDNNIEVSQTVTNIVYGEDNKAISYTKTDTLGQSVIIFDIEYDELNRIAYCKQKDSTDKITEFTNFHYGNNGEFINCKSSIIGSNFSEDISKNLINNVYKSVSLDNLVYGLTEKDMQSISEDEKKEVLQKITQLVQILESLKSTKVNYYKEHLKENDILTPKYKLDTPLLQVFSSTNTAQEYISGENNLTEIINLLTNKNLGNLSTPSPANHVLSKIAENIAKIVFKETYAGNYQYTEIGNKLIDLGFKLKATDQHEALEYALKHLYYNAANILKEDVIQRYHYKKLDNFIMVKL